MVKHFFDGNGSSTVISEDILHVKEALSKGRQGLTGLCAKNKRCPSFRWVPERSVETEETKLTRQRICHCKQSDHTGNKKNVQAGQNMLRLQMQTLKPWDYFIACPQCCSRQLKQHKATYPLIGKIPWVLKSMLK